MKRLIIVLALSLSLGACAQWQAVTGALSIATKTIANPVTKDELYAVEATARILTEALLTYRKACLAGNVDKHCRQNIEAIQPYTRQVDPLLLQLRGFVKNNDQINAVVIYNQLTQLYRNVKSSAAQLGIPLGV